MNFNDLKPELRLVTSENIDIYNNLIQCYEAEFSSITEKAPEKDGKFPLDTHLEENVSGYLYMNDDIPLGFATIKLEKKNCEVCEFYIIPYFRNNGLGESFAFALFNKHKGNWEIKQLLKAHFASKFWRKVLDKYTKGNFKEDIYEDLYWSKVIRQSFSNR